MSFLISSFHMIHYTTEIVRTLGLVWSLFHSRQTKKGLGDLPNKRAMYSHFVTSGGTFRPACCMHFAYYTGRQKVEKNQTPRGLILKVAGKGKNEPMRFHIEGEGLNSRMGKVKRTLAVSEKLQFCINSRMGKVKLKERGIKNVYNLVSIPNGKGKNRSLYLLK